jgi:hypothetical protein
LTSATGPHEGPRESSPQRGGFRRRNGGDRRRHPKITYVYDLGDWWQHEITLEKILDPDDALTYPACVTGREEAPVEDWNPDYPQDPVPFDKDVLNHDLAKLSRAS